MENLRKIELGGERLDIAIGACLFRHNSEGKKEFLLVKGPSGQWHFPGGKMREGEDWKKGLRRELEEEVGIIYDGDFEGSGSKSPANGCDNKINKSFSIIFNFLCFFFRLYG